MDNSTTWTGHIKKKNIFSCTSEVQFSNTADVLLQKHLKTSLNLSFIIKCNNSYFKFPDERCVDEDKCFNLISLIQKKTYRTIDLIKSIFFSFVSFRIKSISMTTAQFLLIVSSFVSLFLLAQ